MEDYPITKMIKVLENSSNIQKEEVRSAARAWLTEAEKMEHRWSKSAPTMLEITKKDRRHD